MEFSRLLQGQTLTNGAYFSVLTDAWSGNFEARQVVDDNKKIPGPARNTILACLVGTQPVYYYDFFTEATEASGFADRWLVVDTRDKEVFQACQDAPRTHQTVKPWSDDAEITFDAPIAQEAFAARVAALKGESVDEYGHFYGVRGYELQGRLAVNLSRLHGDGPHITEKHWEIARMILRHSHWMKWTLEQGRDEMRHKREAEKRAVRAGDAVAIDRARVEPHQLRERALEMLKAEFGEDEFTGTQLRKTIEREYQRYRKLSETPLQTDLELQGKLSVREVRDGRKRTKYYQVK